jgi:hypothetical protein
VGFRHTTTAREQIIHDINTNVLNLRVHKLREDVDRTTSELCPPRRDRHVTFELPKMETAADAVKATAAIVTAVAEGELTPSDAGELSRLVDAYTRMLERQHFPLAR